MLRLAVIVAAFLALTGASAFRSVERAANDMPYAVNSSSKAGARELSVAYPDALELHSDVWPPHITTLHPKVLMLNYSAYDSAYANKVRRIIERRLPGAVCQDFWEGSDFTLREALDGKHVVIIAYPSGGQFDRIRAYGKILDQFVRQGGVVIFTGTHHYNVLQQFNLLEISKGYFCKEPQIRESDESHALLQGIPRQFSLSNYAYPLEITDPGFVSLADVQGYPVLGYKISGAGRILYIGLEYYYDEAISSRILANAIQCGMPEVPAADVMSAPAEEEPGLRTFRTSTEMLYAGTGNRAQSGDQIDLKIYPNPYAYKGVLEVDLDSPAVVAIDMTDVNGRTTAVLLPKRTLNQGFYRFELPDVEPGIYLVQCQFNEYTYVRKVVKTAAP